MSKKIMVVDDDMLITSTLAALLEMMLDYEVICYNNPKEALEDEYLKNRQIDLIISDFIMPELDGFEFLKIAQTLHPSCMKILLTGYADKSSAIKCINELNLYYYLEKPWDNEDLLKVISNATETQRLDSELREKVVELEKANQEISHLYKLLKEDYNESIHEKSNLQRDLLRRTMDMKKILDHADQGFLLLNKDLSVYPEYSQKCLEFFMKDIGHLNFPDLVYPDNTDQRDFLSDILMDIQNGDDNLIDMYLPLLPDEVVISDIPLHMTFNIMKDDDYAYFITLTDISEKKSLESKLESEKQVLQMLVGAFSQADEIKEVVSDYHFFIERSLPALLETEDAINEVFRQIHTFKGLCAQVKLHHSAKRLHEIEDILSINSDRSILKAIRFDQVMTKDLDLFDDYLGKEFLNQRDEILVDKDKLIALERNIVKVFSGDDKTSLLKQAQELRYKPLVELFRSFGPYIEELSESMNKPMYPLGITGDQVIIDHDIYRDFSKSLIHVIRNMMDHGIEESDTRLGLNKPYQGSIQISVIEGQDEIVLIIENDGQKIDLDKIRSTAERNGIDTSQMTQDQIMMLIFKQHISTSDQVTNMSGRGVGLASVKYEVERLNGKVFIESDDSHTRYIFKLPYYKGYISKERLTEVLTHAMELYLTKNNESYRICNINDLDNDLHSVKLDLNGIYDCTITLLMDHKTLDGLMNDFHMPSSHEYCTEMLKEILNTVMGNSLQMLPGSEHLLEVGLPVESDYRAINKDTKIFDIGNHEAFLGIEIKGE
ncbi:response regulator [Acidaminobacter sp. JC074]|uniref:response regulator n=1 Tax=Acidaminobacter sp. JC074 TaxID=2530199 RepID=UPI001F0DA843|nr:response regulator [Acidaminobacter sp. JC074]